MVLIKLCRFNRDHLSKNCKSLIMHYSFLRFQISAISIFIQWTVCKDSFITIHFSTTHRFPPSLPLPPCLPKFSFLLPYSDRCAQFPTEEIYQDLKQLILTFSRVRNLAPPQSALYLPPDKKNVMDW